MQYLPNMESTSFRADFICGCDWFLLLQESGCVCHPTLATTHWKTTLMPVGTEWCSCCFKRKLALGDRLWATLHIPHHHTSHSATRWVQRGSLRKQSHHSKSRPEHTWVRKCPRCQICLLGCRPTSGPQSPCKPRAPYSWWQLRSGSSGRLMERKSTVCFRELGCNSAHPPGDENLPLKLEGNSNTMAECEYQVPSEHLLNILQSISLFLNSSEDLSFPCEDNLLNQSVPVNNLTLQPIVLFIQKSPDELMQSRFEPALNKLSSLILFYTVAQPLCGKVK